jgi:uncharacterized glyoxalase superfamily protein PhnB
MAGWAVIPSIRVPDMRAALDFYQRTLGFALDREEPSEENNSLSRGDARIMLETPAGFYSERYNEAIRERLGTPSSMALYIEAPDLEEFYERLIDGLATVVDPLAERPWGQREFTVADHVGNWLTFWKRD